MQSGSTCGIPSHGGTIFNNWTGGSQFETPDDWTETMRASSELLPRRPLIKAVLSLQAAERRRILSRRLGPGRTGVEHMTAEERAKMVERKAEENSALPSRQNLGERRSEKRQNSLR